MNLKKELRKEILQLRNALTEEERREKSHQIAEKVIAKKEFREADKVLLFASYKSEVETFEIFEAARMLGKDVYYPKVIGSEMKFHLVEKGEDLIEGYRSIQEPEANPEKQFRPKQTDRICIIMPGVVFDEEGNRIGYGGGYYDKFLQQIRAVWTNSETMYKEHIHKIAIGFACQMVEVGRIESEQHDIKADCIVTEYKILSN